MNEIIDLEDVSLPAATDALTVYTTPGAIEPYLQRVRDIVANFSADADTDAGRTAIKSMAHKVSKVKAAFERFGKQLADDQKAIPKKIDATRRLIDDELSKLRDDIRAPVTQWEQEEETRVNAIKAVLARFQEAIDDREQRHSQYLKDWLGDIRAVPADAEHCQEYAGAAAELSAKAISVLETRLAEAEKREAEQEELAKLRAEAEERARIDREADIAAEAAEAARKRVEAEAAEREAALVRAKEDAERRATEAAAKALRELEDQKRREAEETAKREADKTHKAKINRAAVAALVDGGIDEAAAKLVITLIAKKSIPHVTIAY